MNTNEYIKSVMRTNGPAIGLPEDKFRLMHCALGLVTEAGELADVVKKHLCYGKPLQSEQVINIKEEMGDLLWYIANLCDLFDYQFEDLMEANIRKLRTRYPEKFELEKSDNRDLNAEFRALQ
jgi:NTP pyrophosphatase (non-canonical NTP hydrolase)